MVSISQLLFNKHIDPHKFVTMFTHSLPIGATDTKVVQYTTKLNSTNFSAWMMQFNALLIGYDLFGFVDGPKPSLDANHANYNYWMSQDKLILYVISSSEVNQT